MDQSIRGPSERLDGIQALRGIAALGVALFHFSVIEQIYGPDRVTSDVFTYGQAGVDLFFVISGYIMVHATRGMRAGGSTARTFLSKRLLRIYPPYWVITLAICAIWFVSSGAMLGQMVGAHPNFSASFALWPHERPPVLNVGWTLSHEVYFYGFFALALLAPNSARPSLLLAWGAAMAAIHIAGLRGSPLMALASHPLNIEFIFGAIAAWLRPKLGPCANRAALLIALIFAAATLAHWGFAPHRDTLRDHAMRAALFGPLAACLVFVCAGMDLKWPLVLRRLGDWSFALYLVHIPAFAITGAIWKKVAMPGIADNILAMLIMVGSAIACAQLFYKYVERPLTRLRMPVVRPKLA